MDEKDLPIGDVIFYGIVTAVFMATAMFGAVEGCFSSGVSTFEGPPASDGVYIILAAFYGVLFGTGCSTPFLLTFLILRLGAVTNRRILTIWIVGNMSACCFAVLLMALTLTVSALSTEHLFLLLGFVAAVPPGLQGLKLIMHVARYE